MYTYNYTTYKHTNTHTCMYAYTHVCTQVFWIRRKVSRYQGGVRRQKEAGQSLSVPACLLTG